MTRILMADLTDYRGPTPIGSHALARQFMSAGAQVMWVGTPLYPHTLLRARDTYTQRRIDVWKHGGVRSDSITEYYPFTLLPVMNRPFLRSRAVARNTLRVTVPPVGGVIARHGFDQPDLLWLSASRISFPLMSMVRARKRAYRLSDDWGSFPVVPRSLIDLETEIIDKVDAVFVTARILEERIRVRRPDVVYLPNGVDDAFFDAPAREDDMVTGHARPRVVFAGALGDWIDYEAVAHTARKLPHTAILLVGPGRRPDVALPANVHFTGPVPYERLPAVLHACDAGIVPFRRTARTEAASSNKVYQYLAAGLPVVASRTHELESSASPVVLCDSPAEFADAVAAALADPSVGRAERVAFARQHTWARRADVVRRTLGF